MRWNTLFHYLFRWCDIFMRIMKSSRIICGQRYFLQYSLFVALLVILFRWGWDFLSWMLRWSTFILIRLYIINDFLIGSGCMDWRFTFHPWLSDRFFGVIFLQLICFLPMIFRYALYFYHLSLQSLKLFIFVTNLIIKLFDLIRVVFFHCNIIFLHLANFLHQILYFFISFIFVLRLYFWA